ncbi:Aldolase-type TIM barrel [Penicillium occitanis (nom. inval.)]|nr:Aldolase-type TIM barrel [Penicillium occitanis (nom. inval.)]
MAERLAKRNRPTKSINNAYEQWSKGGWGCILTGNIQVDVNHLGDRFDLALQDEHTKDERLLAEWKTYAAVCQRYGTPAIAQICHPGRQSMRRAGRRGVFASTIAPSAVPMNVGNRLRDRITSQVIWSKPREMTRADIEDAIGRFVNTARVMSDAGFSGVELHGAHGYLIDQFMGSMTNRRTDEYGGSPERRARLVLDILTRIRKVVPKTFCIGIKLNSADHSTADFEEIMIQIKLLVDAGLDFMEISGGSYEDPRMVGYPVTINVPKSESAAAREAFFFEFARTVRAQHPSLVLMLTGGFRTRAGMEAAIRDNACDLVGIGRPATVDPKFPLLLLDEKIASENAALPLKMVPLPFYATILPRNLVGAGAETTYYADQIRRLAEGLATFAPR